MLRLVLLGFSLISAEPARFDPEFADESQEVRRLPAKFKRVESSELAEAVRRLPAKVHREVSDAVSERLLRREDRRGEEAEDDGYKLVGPAGDDCVEANDINC